jgi:hypothetical protein
VNEILQTKERRFKMSHTKPTYCFLIAVLFLFILGQCSFAQFFLKSYDFAPSPTKTEMGYSIEKNFDGTLVGKWTVAGVSNSTPNAGSFDWMFLKLTNTGAVSCATLLGFSLADSCFSHIQLLSTSRNVLAGFYRAPNGKEKASFSILDTNCTHLFSKQIVDSLRHEYRQVVKNTADIFTMAGSIETFISPGVYKNRILAAQYSPTGILMWAYRYMPPPGYEWVDEKAYSIVYEPTTGTYGITGITNRFTGAAGPYQVFIMKISATGIPVWFKGYSPAPGAPSQSRKIIALPDAQFAVCGSSTAFDPAGDIYIFKVNMAGALVWSNTYGMAGITEQSESIIYQASDMSLVFTGSATLPATTEDIILSKITMAAGMPIWTKKYPNASGSDRGYDLKEAPVPAGYSVTGKLFHPTSAGLDPFFLKTDAVGNVTPGCQDSTMLQPRQCGWTGDCQRQPYQLTDTQIQPQVIRPVPVERALCGTVTGVTSENEIPKQFALKQNYPNPFNPSTKIEFSLPENGNVSITVFDITGKLVATVVNGFKTTGNYSVEFNASGLSSGIYFYTLKAEGFEETKKMLLVK